jgi:hypothetical protein
MRNNIPATKERGRLWGGLQRAGLVLLGCLLASSVSADPDEALATKAKFIFQLTKYVSWPDTAHESAETPLVIGVLANPALAETLLDVVANKKVRGRDLEIVPLESPEEAGVHLLVVARSGRSSLRRLARLYQDGNVFTVADEFDFPELGGDVGIELVRDRISFSINRRKLTRGDFNISSKLMRLASEVK